MNMEDINSEAMLIKLIAPNRAQKEQILLIQNVNIPESIRDSSTWVKGAVEGILDTMRVITYQGKHYCGKPRLENEVIVTYG
jgi:hypothetical protein